MKKLLSLLSTLTIGSTAIPSGYAMYPYNLENNSKLSGEWNYGGKSFDWKDNYLTTNVGKPKLRDFIPAIYDTEVQIKELDSRIDFLWKKITDSEQEKTNLKKAKKKVETKLEKVTEEKTALEADLKVAQEKVTALEAEFADLKTKLEGSEQEKAALEASNKELQEKVNELAEKTQG